MSAYNETDKGEWVYNHVYTLIKEIVKGPDSYRKYSEEVVKNVVKELDKGEISIKVDFDELWEAGFKVNGNQRIFLYRLYELSCNE